MRNIIYLAIRLATRMRQEESGQGLMEYALILGLVVVLAVAALTLIGSHVTTMLSTVANGV
jgi:pilus assembly protein Flp/PilA